jgi:F0F1-type ATP synthase membrane subunit b/b'
MKNKYFIAAVILFMAGSVFTGCNNNRDKVENAEENVKKANQELIDAKAQYEKEWQQFNTDAELKISANEKKISDFKALIKTASGKSKAKYEKEVLELEQKNVELRKNLSEYKYEGKDSWETFKKISMTVWIILEIL